MTKSNKIKTVIILFLLLFIAIGFVAFGFSPIKTEASTGNINAELERKSELDTATGCLKTQVESHSDLYDSNIVDESSYYTWANGWFSDIKVSLKNTLDEPQILLNIYRTNKNDYYNKNSDDFGTGWLEVSLYEYNENSETGRLVHRTPNADKKHGINIAKTGLWQKTITPSDLDLEIGKSYSVQVVIRWLCKHGSFWLNCNLNYKTQIHTIKESDTPYNEGFVEEPVYIEDGVYYYNEKGKVAYNWTDGAESTSNGYDIFVQPTARLDVNGKGYQKEEQVKKEGAYEFKLYNSERTIDTVTVIRDHTAPTVSVANVFSSGNMFGKNTKVEYGADKTKEAPIQTATYTRRKLVENATKFEVGEILEESVPFESGKKFSDTGVYTLTVADAVGNTTVKEMVIKGEITSNNQNYILNTAYFKSDNYKVRTTYLKTITVQATLKTGEPARYPGSYSNANTYIFATYENALRCMCEIEMQEAVIVTGENTWRYKQKNNANATATYMSKEDLWEVVEHYAKNSVSQYGETLLNSSIYADNHTVVKDLDVLSNTSKEGKVFIGKSYQHESLYKTLATEKGTYNYRTLNILIINNDVTSATAFPTNKTFGEIVGDKSGEISITEMDSLGNTTSYLVFFDVSAPTINASYEIYTGELDTNNQNVIEKRDIFLSTGLEIDNNFKSFSINNISDTFDDIVTVRIECPDGTVIVTRQEIQDEKYLTFGEGMTFSSGGEYRVKVYDRSLNMFEYVFSVAGKSPKLTAGTSGYNDSKMLNLAFANGDAYSSITHFKIYRYDELLPEEGVYKEYFNDRLVNQLDISQNKWSYSFWRGGEYYVVFTDSFNRITFSEVITFTKGLPEYTLTGVTVDGKTNKTVIIEFDEETIGYMLLHDGNTQLEYGSVSTNGYRIEIPASASTNGYWQVTLYNKADVKTKLSFAFTIDTLSPIALAYDESLTPFAWGTSITAPFFVDWTDNDVARIRYTIDNGYLRVYEKGKLLTDDGVYVFTITDDIGNVATYSIELDSTVSYGITLLGKNYTKDNVIYVKDGFSITQKENLNFVLVRDEMIIDALYNFDYREVGTYNLTLTDVNLNSITLTVIVDRTPPEIAIVQSDTDIYAPITVTLDKTDVASLRLYFRGTKQTVEIKDEYRFTDWGEYSLTVADALGNSETHEFTIAKKEPIVKIWDINGSEIQNNGALNNAVYFTWDDENATAKYSLNGALAKTYEQNSLLTDEGVYTLTVTDQANNKVSVSVSIVKVINYQLVLLSDELLETVVVNGTEKTNKPFSVQFEDELTVTVKKDDVDYPYVKGQTISIDGIYKIHIADTLGNYEERVIIFDTQAPAISYMQSEDLTLPVTVELDTSDVKTVVVEFVNTLGNYEEFLEIKSVYEFTDWGTYTITVSDALGNSETVTFTIEKVKPGIVIRTLSGRILNDNDISSEGVIIEFPEEVVVKYKINTTYSLFYTADTILSEQGTYFITIKDVNDKEYNYTIFIDNEISVSVVIDGQTVKNFANEQKGKRYIELTQKENLTVTYSINDGADVVLTDTVKRFEEEGNYEFLLIDNVGNSITLFFELDYSAPTIFIDTENYTRSDVVLTVDDINDIDTYTVKKDGARINKFVLGKMNLFTEAGVYSVTVQDDLANKKVLEFTIKRGINYKTSVANGFITDGNVSLTLKEKNLSLSAKLNGELFELPNSELFTFTEVGVYEITMSDSIGNTEVLTFTLDAKKHKKVFTYNVPLDSTIVVTKDGENIDIDDLISGDTLTINQDGNYTITLTKNGVTSSYSFVIDNIIPALILNGKVVQPGTNIGSIRDDFTIGATKKKADIKVYFNGDEVEYVSSEEFSAPGIYKIVITDEVGNVVEYEFEREFTFNAGAIVLFVMLGVGALLVVFLVVRRRIKMRIT